MAITDIIRKIFSIPEERYDEDGRLVRKMTQEDKILEKLEEKERRRRVRARLVYLQKKHTNELKPFHLKAPKKRRNSYY